jgi:SNF2 family DNA or RNA helicase
LNIETLKSHYDLPLNPRPDQIEDFESLVHLKRTALFNEPGLGKTFVSLMMALGRFEMGLAKRIIVVVPPILIENWAKTFAGFKRDRAAQSSFAPLTPFIYRGTPSQRRKILEDIHLVQHPIIIVSIAIFRTEFALLVTDRQPAHVILDEATCIKNVGTSNFRAFKTLFHDHSIHSLSLLTGTPMNKPEDGYAYIRLKTPFIYKSYAMFESNHVAMKDTYNRPLSYKNLEELQRNLFLFSARRLRSELPNMPSHQVIPMWYNLDPKHLKLYRTMVEDQFLEYTDGTKLDIKTVTELWIRLQQVVMNVAHFSRNESDRPAGLDVLDEVLEEIGERKLVVFAHYKMTNRMLSRLYADKAVGIWGDLSSKQKESNLRRFIEDTNIRMIHLQPTSAGYGIDGLQRVCSDMLFLEVPMTPNLYEQCMARLVRDGQKECVNVRVALAQKTLQVKLFKALAEKQDLVNSIQFGVRDLKAALLGEV